MCVYFEEQEASRKCSTVSLWKRPFVVHTLPGSWSGSSLSSSLISSLDTPVHRRSATATGNSAKSTINTYYRLTGLYQRSCFPSIYDSLKKNHVPHSLNPNSCRRDGVQRACDSGIVAGDGLLSDIDDPFLTPVTGGSLLAPYGFAGVCVYFKIRRFS